MFKRCQKKKSNKKAHSLTTMIDNIHISDNIILLSILIFVLITLTILISVTIFILLAILIFVLISLTRISLTLDIDIFCHWQYLYYWQLLISLTFSGRHKYWESILMSRVNIDFFWVEYTDDTDTWVDYRMCRILLKYPLSIHNFDTQVLLLKSSTRVVVGSIHDYLQQCIFW